MFENESNDSKPKPSCDLTSRPFIFESDIFEYLEETAIFDYLEEYSIYSSKSKYDNNESCDLEIDLHFSYQLLEDESDIDNHFSHQMLQYEPSSSAIKCYEIVGIIFEQSP